MVRNVALLKMILVAAALAATATPARSDAVAGFYKGRTVSLIIGYSVGSGYDLYARLLARFIGRYIPGHPTVLAQTCRARAA